MNCVGCHSHGGGGMGPALMDGKWRYGGRIDQIAASISEGRPNGMPGMASQADAGQLAAGCLWRSLAGLEPIDAVSARTDSMSNTPPQTQLPPQGSKVGEFRQAMIRRAATLAAILVPLSACNGFQDAMGGDGAGTAPTSFLCSRSS